jgi:hypothetical protein
MIISVLIGVESHQKKSAKAYAVADLFAVIKLRVISKMPSFRPEIQLQ